MSIVSGAGFLAGPADVSGLTATETPNRLRGEEDTVIHSGMREIYEVRRDNVGLDQHLDLSAEGHDVGEVLCLNPRGIGRIGDTTLQKDDRLFISRVFGISG